MSSKNIEELDLSAIIDDKVFSILSTLDQPLTVKEIGEKSDVSEPAIYRFFERWKTEEESYKDLVEKTDRINHRYSRPQDSLTIDLQEYTEDGVENDFFEIKHSYNLLSSLGEYKKAKEISSENDIPISTTYRALDMMEKADILETDTTLSGESRRVKKYQRTIDGIELDFEDGEFYTVDSTQLDSVDQKIWYRGQKVD